MWMLALAGPRPPFIFRVIDPGFSNCQESFLNRPLSRLMPKKSPRNLRLWVLFSLLVAVMQFSDPLGDVSVGLAVAFWLGRLGGVGLSLVLAEFLLTRYCGTRWNSPPWLKPAIIMIVVAAIPMTAVEVLLETWIPQLPEFDDSAFREMSPWLAALGEYLTVLSIVLPANVLLWVLIDRREASGTGLQNSPDRPAMVNPAFLARANGIGVQDIVALGAEEHYVRVWTRDRSELLYGRFSDAVSEMPESAGIQVHRSWWVAEGAVTNAVRGARRYRLELSNGSVVPVSDRYLMQVRKRGWLAKVRRASGSSSPK